MPSPGVLSRAQGCLMGQLAGDSLGGLVEFKSLAEIRRLYPDGVRKLAHGGTWNTLAGQPTDDSEMALMLARMLTQRGAYDEAAALQAYRYWLQSGPFDCGTTTASGLGGQPDLDSQANGALMRISPLGIFGALRGLEQTAQWAMQDARLTHPHLICQQANALFAMAIAEAVGTEAQPLEVYRSIVGWADMMKVSPQLKEAITGAAESKPAEYVRQKGWVLIAFRNALWQLLHAPTLEAGIVDTVLCGGDTDTNAAICGALLGAIHGLAAVPEQWTASILNCRPQAGQPNVHRPRPQPFWPVDALELAEALVSVG